METGKQNFFVMWIAKICTGKYRAYTIFIFIMLLYVFRWGFWGVDFLGLCYTLFLCIPFFLFFIKASFLQWHLPILIAVWMGWAVFTHTYPVFWILLLACFYRHALFSLRNRRQNVQKRIQFWKTAFLFLLFVSTYEPLKATWYIEPVVWIRLYIFYAGMVIFYAGCTLFFRDLKVYQDQKRMKHLEKKVPVHRRAI